MALGDWLRGGQGMLMRTLRGTEWSELLDYLSPSFFDVMPLASLTSQGRELLGNARDAAGVAEQRAGVQRLVAQQNLPLHLVDDLPSDGVEIRDLPAEARRALGDHALELYFSQLYQRDAALLDLRAGRFRSRTDATGVAWDPRPFWVRWDPSFVGALRDLYAGFYLDDEARYADALARLDLKAADDVFQKHFGEGDQRAVLFRSAAFRESFHEVFVRCRDAGVSLHPNFVALGVYLACLYDLLETVDEPLDVRAAFARGFPA